jgi:hypothetical protein
MSHRLPPMVQAFANQDPNKMDISDSVAQNKANSDKLPKAFKFGQVDQNLLMSRLYSTPFKQPMPSTAQQFSLDMSMTSMHKPRIKKLETPPPHPEPIVINLYRFI